MMTLKINRTILELEFPSLEEALKTREQLAAEVVKSMEKSLEKLYARLPENGLLIEIEKLEIDLGRITTDISSFDLSSRIEALLEEELTMSTVWNKQFLAVSFAGDARYSNLPNTDSLPPGIKNFSDDVATLKTETVQLRSADLNSGGLVTNKGNSAASTFEIQEKILLYYLSEGVLPWWAADQDPDLEKIFTRLISEHPEKIKEALVKLPKQAFKRIAVEFSKELHEKLGALIGENLITAQTAISLEASKNQGRQLIRIRGELLNHVHSIRDSIYSLAKLSVFDSEIKKLICGLRPRELINLYESLKFSTVFSKELRAIALVISKGEVGLSQQKIALKNQVQAYTKTPDHINNDETARGSMISAYEELKKEEKECLQALHIQQSTPCELPLHGLLIENAGLVILAPYLPMLFAGLSLTTPEYQFISKKAAYKAVMILHKLSGGRSGKTVNNFPLNKLLAGLRFDESIPVTTRLSAKELLEIKDLLNSVLSNWGALKSSSIRALQLNFFRRKGKLCDNTDHYSLIVERKDYDLLIERMPWSFKLIRYPWFNTYFIEVLW